VKVFTQRKIKEFSECTADKKAEIFRVLDITEKLILSYFNADNINIEKLALICGLMVWHTPQFSPPNKTNIASFSRFKVSNCA
jgi:hypothetical protein